jgi:pyruvate dehydrogenase E2 component (dihydrolipoamide acetyltransferase)
MTIEFKLPELGENITSGDVVNVLVHEGDTIAANDGVIELETDKAVVEIPCPHAGRVAKIAVKSGETVKVGQTILTIEPETEAPPAKKAESPAKAETPKKDASPPAAKPEPRQPARSPTDELLPAGPAARRLARELGVDLRQIQGTGQHGRITPEDVEAVRTGAGAATAPPAREAVTPPGESGQDAWGPVRRDRMPRIRRTIAQQMVHSAQIIPHVTNFDDADVTDLEALRAGIPPGYLGENVRLTAMPFVMRAVAMALRRHPLLNASLDDENEQIVYKEYVNLGVAVDTPRGLVVPVVRNADQMTIPQLARALGSLAQRARAAEFAVEELRGGTFSISNMGAVGGAYSTPIINHPEVAVLLAGRSRWMPVARGERHDRVEVRLLLPLSLSYDHRLVDGAAAARFLNEVIEYLQSPGRLLL